MAIRDHSIKICDGYNIVVVSYIIIFAEHVPNVMLFVMFAKQEWLV